jgi:hypothetical protein
VIAISYRTPPAFLATSEIVAELLWLADAPEWRGSLGVFARERRDALRAELRRREARR